MDHKVCDTMKRLNALKHQTAQKQKRLEKLQTEYQQMVDDSSEAVATDKGESKDAQVGHHQVQSTTVDLSTEDWSSVKYVINTCSEVKMVLLILTFTYKRG